jgi:(1->4)-alpha-D-glucan 1-alpha-D-glucosylmutase
MKQYMIKALREAKVHSSWLRPDENYEGAVLRFIDAILDPRRPFLEAFRPFQSRVAEAGIYNSLSQLAIKIGAPGVPDFYQGTELWDMSLVDPDNRRPVDYTRRQELHADISASDPSIIESLLQHRLDGRVKLMTIVRGLGVRRQMPALFERGDYIPLPTTGAHRERLFTFARVLDSDAVVVCVPRLVATLPRPENQPPVGPNVWEDTQIDVRALPPITAMRDAFTEMTTCVQNGLLDVGAVLGRFPVAMLVGRAT